MSSSSGNCTIIKSKKAQIMIDAGGSLKKISKKYEDAFNKKLTNLDALFISHEHSDHIMGAGVIGRKLNCPIYIPDKSYQKKIDLFSNCLINTLEGGEEVTIKDIKIKTFNTKHDSEACVGFVIIDTTTNEKIGYLTDTGTITRLIQESLKDCDAYMIETDYDEEGLEKYSEYDDYLKERIRGIYGHLSNDQAIDYINSNLDLNKIKWILFSHLSENTNSPEILMNKIKYKIPERYWNKFHIATDIITLNVGEIKNE